jgi:hypothetical protein
MPATAASRYPEFVEDESPEQRDGLGDRPNEPFPFVR